MNSSQFEHIWPNLEQLIGEVNEDAHYGDSEFPTLLEKIKKKLESVITPEGPIVSDEERYRLALADIQGCKTCKELTFSLFVHNLVSRPGEEEELVLEAGHYLFNPVMAKLKLLLADFPPVPKVSFHVTHEDMDKLLDLQIHTNDYFGMMKLGKVPAFCSTLLNFNSLSFLEWLVKNHNKVDEIWLRKASMALATAAIGNDVDRVSALAYFNLGAFEKEYENAPYHLMFNNAIESNQLSVVQYQSPQRLLEN